MKARSIWIGILGAVAAGCAKDGPMISVSATAITVGCDTPAQLSARVWYVIGDERDESGTIEYASDDELLEVTPTAEYNVMRFTVRALKPFTGTTVLHIAGTTLKGTVTAEVTVTFQDDGTQCAPLPPPPPPPPPPPSCPVGDLLFTWSSDGPGPVNGLLSFAGLGGEVCRAVPWELNPTQDWPTVSPDERRVAYVAAVDLSEDAIYTVPIDGGVDEAAMQDPDDVLIRGTYAHLAWAPNGLWIAATDARASPQRIVLVRVHDGQVFPLPLLDPGSAEWHPTWSPDLDDATPGYQGRLYHSAGDPRAFADLVVTDVTEDAGGVPGFGAREVLGRHDDPGPNAVGVFGFFDPACSPNGSKIAFRNALEGGRVLVYHTGESTDGPAGLPTQGAFSQDLSTPGTEPDEGDVDPAWWDEDTIVFTRQLGDSAFGGIQPTLFQVRASGANQAEITDADGLRLPGHAEHPAVVPEALRRP